MRSRRLVTYNFFTQKMTHPFFSIAVHGGAGTIARQNLSPEAEYQYRKALSEAVQAGSYVLANGGTALDAVEIAVKSLEDCPLFNAGRGAVFTHTGKHELDAAIMCGQARRAGAVAGIVGVRNPISLARSVMEKSEHVLLCGEGAEQFARTVGAVFELPDYFYTDFRYRQWQIALADDMVQLDHNIPTATNQDEAKAEEKKRKFGTVGAVACDQNGHVAAATSTGGMTNKKFGRIGDSPLIGCGTYADNSTCAVSCTGHGEYFIRAVTAYDVACLMRYKGLSLKEACQTVVYKHLPEIGGEGGLIAVDAQGNLSLDFNSEGMYRAYQQSGGPIVTAIFKE